MQPEKEIVLNDILIYFYRKSIKNIYLRIDRSGHVKMSVPMRCSMKRAMDFLHEKEDWITHHVNKLSEKQALNLVSQNKETCWFLGKCYPLHIHESDQVPRIHLEENHIACFVKPLTSNEVTEKMLMHWHQQQMKALLPELIKKWEPILGVQVHEWGIRSMISRWGSCNTQKKRIWLNLHLIQKPFVCLEYVLVHEMVHLLEASHNYRFHALMTQFLPAWRTYKQMLNTHQS